MIFQVEAAECSLACVAMVASYHGHHTSLADLRRIHPISLQGLSLRTLVQILSLMGMKARPLRCGVDSLQRVALPALLHWDTDHFVVLDRISRGRFTIHDPARGILTLTPAELSNHFTGIAVEVEPSDGFKPAPRPQKLTLLKLLGNPRSLKAALTHIFLLSAIMELLALMQPLLFRSIVDAGPSAQDLHFTAKIVGVLLVAAVLYAATGFLRDYAVLDAGTSLNFYMAQRLFRHTIGLPLGFFEKRPIGHLIERYRITDEIERFLITSLPLGFIDGLMTLLSLGIIVYLSPALGGLCLLTVASFFALKAARYRSARAREEALIWAKGEENGHLIETLRTIFTTKAAALEQNRYTGWFNLHGRLIQAQKAFGIVDVGQRAGKQGIIGIHLALFVLIAVTQTRQDDRSLGTLLAAIVYNSHFISRSTLLVERFFEFRLLDVRLDRLEDLVFSEPEETATLASATAAVERLPPAAAKRFVEPPLSGDISIEQVSFQYGQGEAPILDNLSCRIAPGELIAIVGDNGAGKTTLLKLLLGLYRPTKGRICYDGINLDDLPLAALRSRVGVVTQDDQLLTGSLAENIALFDPELDMERVINAARLACVHQDIERLPMRYNTRVGDLGSPLSEGQKQKLFIARALYREPRILLMDEGTANLDAASEMGILKSLAELPATKVLIAHRAATIGFADRVLLLKNGGISVVSQAEIGRGMNHRDVFSLDASSPVGARAEG